MGIFKDLKEIKETTNRINERLDTQIVEKAKKYDEIIELLEKLTFNAEIKQSLDKYGNICYNIIFKSPTVTLEFDENKDVIKNDFMYSMNFLNLSDYESQQVIARLIYEEKTKN